MRKFRGEGLSVWEIEKIFKKLGLKI